MADAEILFIFPVLWTALIVVQNIPVLAQKKILREKEKFIMTNVNNIVLQGNLTDNCKVTAVGNGKKATMTLAINRDYKGKDGQYQTEVYYIDVETWCKNGDYFLNNFKKGTPVEVVGELRQDRWEKDGVKRSRTYVYGEKFFAHKAAEKSAPAKDTNAPAEEIVAGGTTEDMTGVNPF